MLGRGWEGQILTNLSVVKGPGGSLKEFLTRGISIMGGLWESFGRGVGALGAKFVVPGEVWERCELDLLCLAGFR